MPQLQWLGKLDDENVANKNATLLGQSISGGIGAYVAAKEKGKTNAIAQEELEIKKEQVKHDYAKLDYDKRKDMYDTMVKLLPNIPPDKQSELTTSPEWTELEKSLGMPSLSNTIIQKEPKEASWSNEQKVAAVRADLARGRVSPKRDSFGISEPITLDSEQAALDHITDEGLDPALFTNELAKYKTGTVSTNVESGSTSPTGMNPYAKEYPDAFKEGGVWKVRRNGKKYIIQE